MKRENGFVLPVVLVVIALLLAGGGFYYYTKVRQQKEDEASKRAIQDSVLGTRAQALVPAKNLEEARANVETSASILKNLLNRSKSEQTLITTLESQYKNFGNLIKKTDSLFTDPATDPRIKIANAPVDINAKRAQINTLLQSWNANLATIKALSKSNPSSVTLASLVAKAKSDLAVINSFVTELETTVSNLTILNSNLTQAQIDAEKANIEAVKTESEKATAVIGSVEIVAKSLDVPAVESSTSSGGTASTGTSGGSTSETSTGGSSSSGASASGATSGGSSSTSGATTPPPIVTEAEIEVAKEVVKEAEEVLEEFEETGGSSGGSSGSTEGSSGGSGGSGPTEDYSGEFDGDRWDAAETDGPELVEGANPIAP